MIKATRLGKSTEVQIEGSSHDIMNEFISISRAMVDVCSFDIDDIVEMVALGVAEAEGADE